jgi:hypothetical protein
MGCKNRGISRLLAAGSFEIAKTLFCVGSEFKRNLSYSAELDL